MIYSWTTYCVHGVTHGLSSKLVQHNEGAFFARVEYEGDVTGEYKKKEHTNNERFPMVPIVPNIARILSSTPEPNMITPTIATYT